MIFYEKKACKKKKDEKIVKEENLDEEIIEEEVVLTEEDKGKYKTWFKQQMKAQTGKTKITDMSSEEKKKFFDYIDANWEAKEETD